IIYRIMVITSMVSYRGLTTVSRKNLNKKTGCRDQGTRMTPYALQKFDPRNNALGQHNSTTKN
ncbi:MAG: hypothetical protein LN573_00040, partial [Rickettsia endosymbiont of Oxypoda opaca]|nr:hypothetical protein [Rickettsia endosymbiont of Oxypoda opaca]